MSAGSSLAGPSPRLQRTRSASLSPLSRQPLGGYP
jgi:hypothetical protein